MLVRMLGVEFSNEKVCNFLQSVAIRVEGCAENCKEL